MEFDLSRDISLVTPHIILAVGAMVVLLVDVITKERWPKAFVTGLIFLIALISVFTLKDDYYPGWVIFSGAICADPLSYFSIVLLILGSIAVVILGSDNISKEGIEAPGDYYSLLIVSTLGGIIFATANELITLFLGLEMLSMALYCMCGAALGDKRSSESAVKYFLLGSFSSAFLLYWIALIYGLTGTTLISEFGPGIATHPESGVLVLALGLILVGLVFKLGGVPFHFWVPDVYQGAPTTVTTYMACVVKASAVLATLRVLVSGLGGMYIEWSKVIWLIAFLTMVGGNLLALRQRSVKRMLAFSSVAHAGYILLGFLAWEKGSAEWGAAILYYLVAYTVMSIGSFGLVQLVINKVSKTGSDDIAEFHGLGLKSPVLGGLLALFLLALAGLPPGMAGLFGKVYLFYAVVKANYVGLAVVGILASAVSVYYYLRVIVAMYFIEPAAGFVDPKFSLTHPSGSLIAICGVLVVALGIFPSSLYNAATEIVYFTLMP